MRCVLTATIPVERYAAFAEVAWFERRPELAAVCRAGREAGGTVSIAAVQRVLPGVSEPGARNVLAWCRELGLLDDGGVTALGAQVAEHLEAPVPEQGVFDFWVVEHPLIGRRALHAERLAPTRDVRFEQVEPVGTVPTLGAPFRSVVDPRLRFLVRSFPAKAPRPEAVPRETGAQCRVRWSLDFERGTDRWELDGAIDGGRHDTRVIRHEPERDGLDLGAVIERWARGPLLAAGRWSAEARRLAVRFDGLSEPEQEGFVKDVKLGAVEVPGRGTWEHVTLERVPVEPATAEDAARWAMARLERRLRAARRYWSRDALRRQFHELTAGTPLEPFAPALPPHDELLRRFESAPEVFWGLAAPADLGPTLPRPGEFAAPPASERAALEGGA